jgi:hypothetical protein
MADGCRPSHYCLDNAVQLHIIISRIDIANSFLDTASPLYYTYHVYIVIAYCCRVAIRVYLRFEGNLASWCTLQDTLDAISQPCTRGWPGTSTCAWLTVDTRVAYSDVKGPKDSASIRSNRPDNNTTQDLLSFSTIMDTTLLIDI